MQKVLEKLSNVRKVRGGGYKGKCPSHDDSTASLFISQDGGTTLLKCFARCSVQDIVRDLGLQMSDLFSDDEGEEMEGLATVLVKDKGKKYKSIEDICKNFKTLEAKYAYNRDGEEPSILQIRYTIEGSKSFATFHKEEDGWYLGKGEQGLTPLYNLDAVKEAKSVLIVEGEKVVDLLKDYGIVATTSLGGAQNASGSDFSSLIGKRVAFWRDADEPGLKYESDVQSILNKLGIGLRCVDVNKLNLEKGADLEEFIDLHSSKSKKEITKLIYSLIPSEDKLRPVSYLREHLDKVRSGEIKNYEVPFFPMLTETVRMFKPGSQGVIFAKGGIGKSLFVGRTADDWTLDKSARVKRLMLESPMAFHLTRSLAQQAKRTDVLAEEFHYNNPKESMRIIDEYEDILNTIGDSITTSDTGIKRNVSQWDDKAVVKWISDNAANNDILIIDPVSMALNDPVYIASNNITKGAEEVMAKNPHLCIIFVHHPSDEGTISGGRAWNRFTSVNLEIIMLDEPESYEIKTHDDEIIIKDVTTFIKVRKCRNGSANGWKIAIELDVKDLTLKEIGRMIKKIK